MSIAALILGESGTGKSASVRELDPAQSLLIQVDNKPLPFPSKNWQRWNKQKKQGSIICTDQWNHITAIIDQAYSWDKRIVIIDDFQYVMANEFMRRSAEKGFDKFTEIGRHAWDIVKAAQMAPHDMRIYFMAHIEETMSGKTKMKTIGKMLDEKITIEGMFTIVLKTLVTDCRYLFSTQNSGSDTVKSPMGLFDSTEIDNNLKFVDDRICDYYGINTIEEQVA